MGQGVELNFFGMYNKYALKWIRSQACERKRPQIRIHVGQIKFLECFYCYGVSYFHDSIGQRSLSSFLAHMWLVKMLFCHVFPVLCLAVMVYYVFLSFENNLLWDVSSFFSYFFGMLICICYTLALLVPFSKILGLCKKVFCLNIT